MEHLDKDGNRNICRDMVCTVSISVKCAMRFAAAVKQLSAADTKLSAQTALSSIVVETFTKLSYLISEPLANEGVHFLGLLRRCHLASADCPYRLVSNHNIVPICTIHDYTVRCIMMSFG